MTYALPLIWAFIVALAVFIYVLLDGFDLGVGILMNNNTTQDERDYMVKTVIPVWDGNETWLVLGGGGIFAMFPFAFSVIIPAIYAPIILMLFGLVLRGVSFEYRDASKSYKRQWDAILTFGSFLMAFSQGLALGTLVQGIPVNMEKRIYAGGWWDWLHPFPILTGLALTVGYSLLGACWLIWKTEGKVQYFGYYWAKVAGIGLVALIILVSIWTPFINNKAYFTRWFAAPQIYVLWIIPVCVALVGYNLWRSIELRKHATPFFCAIGLFLLSYIGIGVSFYPYMVPTSVTIWEAAAPENSQMFLLVGVIIFLPIVLTYTAYSYYTFRGKVNPEQQQHY